MRTDARKDPLPRIVVADIGGTNARFGVVSRDPGGDGTELSQRRSYPSAGNSSLEQLLGLYLKELGPSAPRRACLAIAGPNDGRLGHVTNLGWTADAAALEHCFSLEHVLLVNDFAALAAATPSLPLSDTVLLKPGLALPEAPISVLGPGTGLGVALVIAHADGTTTISTEGGHMSFAPTTQLEQELHSQLRTHIGHVSIETLLSGAGLARIHEFLVVRGNTGTPGIEAQEITTRALGGNDPSCVAAAQLFLSIMGSVAGDIALAHGATGGVYLGGGILPRLQPLLTQCDIGERFCAKGPMQTYLQRIPLRLITAEHIALLGAAKLYADLAV